MKRFAFTVAATIAASTSLHAQDLGKKITFECKAEPLSRLLKELAPQTGFPLATDTDIGKEVLIISVTDVTVRDLLSNIAKVTSGVWTEKYRLEGSRSAWDRQAEDLAASKATALHKKLEDSLNKPETKTPNRQSFMQSMRGSDEVATRLCTKILLNSDLTTIASLPVGAKIVMSSSPTAMQVPLTALNAADLQQFIVAHNQDLAKRKSEQDAQIAAEQKEEAKSNPPGTPTEPPVTGEAVQVNGVDMAVDPDGDMDLQSKSIQGLPAKVLLTVSNRGLIGGLSTVLTFLNDKGKPIFYANTTMMDFDDLLMMGMMGGAGVKNKPGETPIVLSPDSKELKSFFAKMGGGSSQPKFSPEVEAELLHPELHDPASFYVSDGMLQLAHERKVQFVADIPDNLVFFDGMRAGESTGSFLDAIKEFSAGVVAQQDNGWLLLSPKQPSACRADRFDRPALSRFINAVHSKGALRLDDMAAFALDADPVDLMSPQTIYIGLFAQDFMMATMMGGSSQWNILRFYAMMDSTQKDVLAQGGSLVVGTLTQGQVDLLPKLVYGSDTTLQTKEKPATGESFGGYDEADLSAFMAPDSTTAEATEVIPQGVPGSIAISAAIISETVVKSADSGLPNRSFGSNSMNADNFAMNQAMSETQLPGNAPPFPKYKQLKVGQRTTITLRFQVLPGLFFTRKLKDEYYPPNAPSVAPSDLPEAFKTAVAKKIKEYKDEMGSDGGDPGKPPPLPWL
jgi:hypothetical protein